MGLVRQDNGIALHLHTDQVGSVRAVEEPNQKMIKEIWYDSFGNVIRDSNPYLPCPLGFAGGLHDHDTGLVRFGWRDYEPDTGRFTAQDPLGAAGGDPDWYGYCLDDPVNAVDKTGLHGKFEKKDSVNDTRNIPSPKTRVDLAQPQLSIVGKNKIQQNDAPTASTIWGLEQSVNRG
ncbi:RHS repeat-associated core domain-containing protein, partial [Paucidesulfovibrio gracilis DSM 16080]